MLVRHVKKVIIVLTVKAVKCVAGVIPVRWVRLRKANVQSVRTAHINNLANVGIVRPALIVKTAKKQPARKDIIVRRAPAKRHLARETPIIPVPAKVPKVLVNMPVFVKNQS